MDTQAHQQLRRGLTIVPLSGLYNAPACIREMIKGVYEEGFGREAADQSPPKQSAADRLAGRQLLADDRGSASAPNRRDWPGMPPTKSPTL